MSSLLITEGLGAYDVPLVVIGVEATARSVTLSFEGSVILTGDALDATNWSISSAAGVQPVTIDSISVDDNEIILATSEHQDGGDYTLNIPQGVIDASDGRPFAGPFTQAYEGVGDLPFIVNVRGIDARAIDVVFSEPVNEDDATEPENYSVTDGPNGVTVISVEKVTDVSYRLTTTAQERDASYTVEVENVRDLGNNPIDTES